MKVIYEKPPNVEDSLRSLAAGQEVLGEQRASDDTSRRRALRKEFSWTKARPLLWSLNVNGGVARRVFRVVAGEAGARGCGKLESWERGKDVNKG